MEFLWREPFGLRIRLVFVAQDLAEEQSFDMPADEVLAVFGGALDESVSRCFDAVKQCLKRDGFSSSRFSSNLEEVLHQ